MKLCVSAPLEMVARIGRGIVPRSFIVDTHSSIKHPCYKAALDKKPREFRLLHHHGGAVLLVARRQRAARGGDRAAHAGGRAVVAAAVPPGFLRRVLCAARALCPRAPGP